MHRAIRFPVVLLLGLLAAAESRAQGRITGVVKDQSGNPVAGAEVTAQGTSRTATTDRTGAFQLTGVATGTSVVTIRRLGFAPSSTIVRVIDGENKLDDFVLIAIPRELDTVATREQQLWREYPLLREFDENRKVGLGQFVTRAELAKHQGGFMSPVLNQMRGVRLIRSNQIASNLWIANAYITTSSCTILEDRVPGEPINPNSPPRPECHYCFPTVYLDHARLAPLGIAANVGRFSPDMLEAMQIYLGPAETPAKYSDRQSGCGVIVLHSRVPELKPRIVARRQDEPTRSRIFATVSASAARTGAACKTCGGGSAVDAMLGYTLMDRWVITGRYGRWSGTSGGSQSISIQQALLEWYPHPEPGKYKWFVNAGAGGTSVSVTTGLGNPGSDSRETYVGSRMPSVVAGTGMDIAIAGRFVVSPFISYTRTVAGMVDQERCVSHVGTSTSETTCLGLPRGERTFVLSQIGTRIGWR